MSAWRRAGAYPVASHGDDVSRSLICFHEFQLLGRADACENVDATQRLRSGGNRHGDRVTLDDVNGPVGEPDGMADTAGGHRVVACDHDNPDSCPPAVADGLRHVGAGGVLEADQANEDESLMGRAVGLRVHLR